MNTKNNKLQFGYLVSIVCSISLDWLLQINSKVHPNAKKESKMNRKNIHEEIQHNIYIISKQVEKLITRRKKVPYSRRNKNQTPGFERQSVPWDRDLEFIESMPRHDVSRADETALWKGRRDWTQPISDGNLKFSFQ